LLRPRLHHHATFRAYLLGIARHVLIDHLRGTHLHHDPAVWAVAARQRRGGSWVA